MGGKQAAIVVICLVVIGAAVFTIVKKQAGTQGPPDAVLQHKIRTIEVGTDTIAEMTLGEWTKLDLDTATGYRKQGGKTLATAIDCPHCQKAIPAAPVSAGAAADPAGPPVYKCPKCGKDVNQAPAEVPAPAASGAK